MTLVYRIGLVKLINSQRQWKHSTG